MESSISSRQRQATGSVSSTVLLHPNHAAPPVVNPVFRGRKPGVISFRGAAMRLWLAGRPTPLLDGSSTGRPSAIGFPQAEIPPGPNRAVG